MWMKVLGALAALFIVSACSTGGDSGAEGQASAAPAVSSAFSSGPVPGTQEDLRVNIGDRVFFDTDRATLRPDARATVERWAAWLGTYPNLTVTIEGHADERGTREYNLALGDRRANSVRDYLVSLGVAGSRLGAVSYGKERPAVPGSNEAAWSQNRRGALVVAN